MDGIANHRIRNSPELRDELAIELLSQGVSQADAALILSGRGMIAQRTNGDWMYKVPA